MWALRSLGAGLDFQRAVKKAGLSTYFRSTTQELPLEDFIQRVFPCQMPADVECIWEWVNLRKAWHMVNEAEFRGEFDEMKQIFNVLAGSREANLLLSSLHRALIFTEAETRGALTKEVRTSLNFEEFLKYFQPELAKKYGNPFAKEVDIMARLGERLRQSLTNTPTEEHLAESEDPVRTADVHAPSLHGYVQSRPEGLPRLPCNPRGCSSSTAGRAAMACFRMQRAAAAVVPSRPAL